MKRSDVAIDEAALSGDSNAVNDDKGIPFLRRLWDMLQENDGMISFSPGTSNKGKITVLGRIIVHDRIQVEAHVLPRYFNHSSFASLRRQLNYFSFVRLGKGRQRESTYINADVVELDDILKLKRRPAGGAVSSGSINVLKEQLTCSLESASKKSSTRANGKRKNGPPNTTERENPSKNPKTVSPRSTSPTESLFVSEDDERVNPTGARLVSTAVQSYQSQSRSRADSDVLIGAAAVLSLRSH